MSVSVSIQANIAIVQIDNPPVNATGHAVRQGLSDAVNTINNNADIKGAVLICAGRTFVAGADIREFGQTPREPHLPDVLMRIESSAKPWVAAIHGTALGGGLELAMACHARVAAATARLGLPEVSLGLLPGAGGTVRLPRLVAAETALDMITGGKPISASAAHAAGLIDAIAEGDLQHCALKLAEKLSAQIPPLATLARPVHPPVDPEAFAQQIAKIKAKARGQNSPKVAADAVLRALNEPARAALTAERTAFMQLKDDPQSRALRHIFFAERQTTRTDRLRSAEPRLLQNIGVIGGGTMGAGIAAACLLAGLTVTLIERDINAAKAGRDRVQAILDNSLKRRLITTEQHQEKASALTFSTDYSALGDADLVIEAVFEDMDVKKQVFAALDSATRPDAVLATNTSYLDVNEIAATVRDPSRVFGLHFFSPAHIMKLLEIIVPEQVADDVLATGVALAKRLKKIAVLAGVCDGFIANRIMSAYRRECEYMLEDGALPWDIDRAMADFGFPMGLFQMQDLAGLDIAWAMRKRQAATRDPAQRYVEIADKLCEMGRLGRKTGSGWYQYSDTGVATPDPDVEALILTHAAQKGITRTPFTPEQIIQRILDRIHSESQAILQQGIAQNPDDIDVVMINAFGFPRWTGGPMHMRG